MNDSPLDRLARLQRLLAAETAHPLKDEAGIIIPRGVDAAQSASGMRKILAVIAEDLDQQTNNPGQEV